MDKTTAATTAGAIALTVAGGVSALFLTVNQATVAEPAGAVTPAVVTEYVDQYGNPVTVAPISAAPSDLVITTVPAAPAADAAGEYALAAPEAEEATEAYEEGEEYEEHEEGEEYEEDHEEGEYDDD